MEGYKKEIVGIEKTLRENPNGMTVTDISSQINLNRNSVAKYLDIMLVSGRVEMRSIGPAKLYFPSHRIPISAMLNFSSDYIMVLDKDLRIIQVNDKIVRFMGAKRDILIGKRLEESPHSIFTAHKTISKIKNALEGKYSESEVHSEMGKKEFYFSIKIIPTTLEYGAPSVTIIVEDITKRKLSEHELKESKEKCRKIFESSPNAITVTDLKANITDCNQATLDLHGYSSKKELIGRNALELIAPEDHGKAKENLKKTVEKGSVRDLEYIFLKKDGKKFKAELSASIVKDFSGNPASFVAITKEITKQRRS